MTTKSGQGDHEVSCLFILPNDEVADFEVESFFSPGVHACCIIAGVLGGCLPHLPRVTLGATTLKHEKI